MLQKRHRRRCERLNKKLDEILRQGLLFEPTAITCAPFIKGTIISTNFYSLCHLYAQSVHVAVAEEDKQIVVISLSDIFGAMDCVDAIEDSDQNFLRHEMEHFVANSMLSGILHFLITQTFSGKQWDILVEEQDRKKICLIEKHILSDSSEGNPKTRRTRSIG